MLQKQNLPQKSTNILETQLLDHNIMSIEILNECHLQSSNIDIFDFWLKTFYTRSAIHTIYIVYIYIYIC